MRLARLSKLVTVRGLVLLSAAALCVGGTAYAVSGAGSPDFTSTLVAAHSGQCLTVPSRGIGLRQAPCDGTDVQRFEFVRSGDTYQIRNVARKACVDIFGGRTEDGAPVTLYGKCAEKANERFTLRATAADRSYMLVSVSSGKCVDVFSGRQAVDTPAVQWTCGSARTAGNEIWKLSAVPSVSASPTASASAAPASSPASSAAASVSPSATPAAPSSSSAPDDPSGTGDASARTPDNPLWGKELPADSLPRSRAYQLLFSDSAKAYRPRSGECSKEIHERYWVLGADGRVYPTWHPAKDPSGCSFGHEHGADPRRSSLFDTTGLPAFGYVNEQLAPSVPASQRNEDHVGYKLFAENGFPVVEGDKVTNPTRPSGTTQQTCSALAMVHQGTHSPDAFASNLHEMNLNLSCKYADNGEVVATRFKALVPFGHPSSFISPCSFQEQKNTGTAEPADSKDSASGRGDLFGTVSGRTIPDESCVDKLRDGGDMLNTTHEFWNPRFNVSESKLKFSTDSMFYVLNPARYYDPSKPDKLGRTVDLCYSVPGLRDRGTFGSCKGIADGVAWDSTASPFNGCGRQFFTTFVLQNTGPATWYTDVYGQRFSETSFPGAIAQHFAGSHAKLDNQAPMHINFKNYCTGTGDGVHAPN
jgi:hypothetical protein